MLDGNLVSALLQASVTGAGLILAIYALVTPILEKIIKVRKELIAEKKQKFDELAEKVKNESSDANLRELNNAYKELKELRSFPKFLSYGVALIFMFYLFASIFAFQWLLQSAPPSPVTEVSLLISFGSATGGFFIVGLFTIIEVARTIKVQWKELEKDREEAEKSTSEELEKLREKVERLAKRNINPT
jgi:hypothetical protein